ncbi:MAG: penicillin-binding protein 2 [Holosporaceae bacterium]|jgi:penicillin-binding protein 2|nr:penicillin-binding protein 2 [Holosporaceae bacterium]
MFNRNPKDEVKFRAKIVILTTIGLSAVLIANLFRLQIIEANKYELLSKKNRIRVSPILPKRGRIITSDGKIVARNAYRYKLLMERCKGKNFQENIEFLNSRVKLEESDLARIANSRKKRLPLILIKDELTWDEYCRLSMILFKINGAFIEKAYAREYPMAFEFAHIVGHVSKNKNDPSILIGKTGIEAELNDLLFGKIGNVQTEVNSVGRKVRIIDSQAPIDGSDVTLTIDSRLQKYVCDVLSHEKAGACVVLDISNGEVLAMASTPSFDPNLLAGKMTRDQWNAIANDPLFPLLNRAIDCSYPPGSIFKIIVAFAALSEGVISPNDKIFCGGGVKLEDRTLHCWNRGGHGYMNLSDALIFSCDCYFFELARRLGINAIAKYAEKFGYGSKTDLELSSENVGLVPSKSWKLLRRGTSWKPYETLIVGIGQGSLLATLTQSAVMFGKIFTGDYDFSPTLIKGERKERVKNPIDSKLLEIIKEALRRVCLYGTASGSCLTDYGIFGKTGSSQVRTIKTNEAGKDQKLFQWERRDHAFFVGCAPYKNPKYVVAVFVEHGGGGASVAAPIARKIFDKLMEK